MPPFTVIALVPAAGSGVRMGVAGSKLLLPLGGTALIERSVRALAGSQYVSLIVLIVPEGERADFEGLRLGRVCAGTELQIVTGGTTRQESVLKGLQVCKGPAYLDQEVYVAVHDGARCLVTSALVDRAIEAAFECQAVTLAVPMADSLKRAALDGRVLESLDRSGVWAVQTPQVFRRELLLEAHARACGSASDDASLVEAVHAVRVVEGAKLNFKITTPEDYELAKKLVECI